MKIKAILLLAFATTSLAPFTHAAPDVNITADIRIGRALPPPPPEIVAVEEVGPPGPPPWAQSRWYRRSHAYYYYPASDVYYRPADRMWFYLDGGDWHLGARLPDHIPMDFDHAVSLRLESDRPYVYHQDVVRYYPKHYFAKVRIKSAPDHRSGRYEDRGDHDDHRDHARDYGERGKGKDKRWN